MSWIRITSDDNDTALQVVVLRVRDPKEHEITKLLLGKAKDTTDLQQVVTHDDWKRTLLLRPTQSTPGVFVYHWICSNEGVLKLSNSTTESPLVVLPPNIRATRLAMACGLLSVRLYGTVLIGRDHHTHTTAGPELMVSDFVWATSRVDLRPMNKTWNTISPPPPTWLSNAAMHNYHDQEVLQYLEHVMKRPKQDDNESEEEEVDDDDDDDEEDSEGDKVPVTFSVLHVPLCLHCRRPANDLCEHCHGAYFCSPPRKCRQRGWSHQCLCPIWKEYTSRRHVLAEFDGLGDWTKTLQNREFQLSNKPYTDFLITLVGNPNEKPLTWWRTEFDGWNGGESDSAKTIDISKRFTYVQGFAPIADIPKEEPAILPNEHCIDSWAAYYKLREIPKESPVAILLTFPLTLYHVITEYGEVPCAVAKMLCRPLRIHIVGAEKEVNFLDLFKEVAYLFPSDFFLELVFVVREDMLPPKLRVMGKFETVLIPNLTVHVVGGTWGDESSLDPKFDCGSGPPDMVVAFNAGLYAYESWRTVVRYLDQNKGVVGVFSDYNEWSAVQCASLGGESARNSVNMNPFRQPRAMPVYSMNLPQYSNGFLYVFNQQFLD